MKHKLFVYGTLGEPRVQKLVFGRVIESKPDRLSGYRKSEIKIGREVYPILVSDNKGWVDGLVLELTDEEIKSANNYETQAYKRVKVWLESGIKAWTYVKRSSAK